MKAVILAGGLGTRLSEETTIKPKPMIEIGGMPILWHIMKIYAHFGVKDFIICAGYKSEVIKDFFINYEKNFSNLSINFSEGNGPSFSGLEPWNVNVIDTGKKTMTGGRLKRIENMIKDGEDFFMTYGDGVADIEIDKLLNFHKKNKSICTVTGTYPPGRFGALNLGDDGKVQGFLEKPRGDGAVINGGFFVLNSKIFEYISDDLTIWEREPMEKIAKEGLMSAFIHEKFWHPMDTLRDKNYLDGLIENNKADWIKW